MYFSFGMCKLTQWNYQIPIILHICTYFKYFVRLRSTHELVAVDGNLYAIGGNDTEKSMTYLS